MLTVVGKDLDIVQWWVWPYGPKSSIQGINCDRDSSGLTGKQAQCPKICQSIKGEGIKSWLWLRMAWTWRQIKETEEADVRQYPFWLKQAGCQEMAQLATLNALSDLQSVDIQVKCEVIWITPFSPLAYAAIQCDLI